MASHPGAFDTCFRFMADDRSCFDRHPQAPPTPPTKPRHSAWISHGSEVKHDQYAKAGIQFYWRVEQAINGVPLIYTYVLDMASDTYRDTEVFSGVATVTAPFPVTIDLTSI
jgi:hypothetical protein